MKAEEKAQDMFVKLLELIPVHVIKDNNEAAKLAKKHALIAVDEIIATLPEKGDKKFGIAKVVDYWQEVKQHLLTLNQ